MLRDGICRQAVYDGALAMAWTAIDLARESRLRNRLITGS